MDIFFAQLFGLYFILVGLIVMIRRCSIMPTVSELARSKALLLVFAMFELAAGLAVILAHPRPALDLSGIISIIGWMMVVESLIYLTLPSKHVQKFVKWFNKPNWYVGGGALSIALGAYLAFIGFGLV